MKFSSKEVAVIEGLIAQYGQTVVKTAVVQRAVIAAGFTYQPSKFKTLLGNGNHGELDLGKYAASSGMSIGAQHATVCNMTEEDIMRAYQNRIKAANDLMDLIPKGHEVFLSFAGAGGFGKTTQIVNFEANYPQIKLVKFFTKMTAVGLFEAMYKSREKGTVMVLDDVPLDWSNDDVRAYFKAALNSQKNLRLIQNNKAENTDNPDGLPREFLFEGSLFWISNQTWDDIIRRYPRYEADLTAIASRFRHITLDPPPAIRQKMFIHDVEFGGYIERKNNALADNEWIKNELLEFIRNTPSSKLNYRLLEDWLTMAAQFITFDENGEPEESGLIAMRNIYACGGMFS